MLVTTLRSLFQANDKNQVTNTTGTSIEHLNEYCLLEIFSVKSLTVDDLCSIAETCTLFQQITRRVFPKDLDIKINSSWEWEYVFSSRRYEEQDIVDAERILKNFGSILTEIVIHGVGKWLGGTSYDLVVQLVAEYCVDSLDSLKIWDENSKIDVKLSVDTTVKLKPILKRLQILHLSYVDIVEDETLFADCDSLVELSVACVDGMRPLLGNTFPKLERFTCIDNYLDEVDEVDQVAHFISRHPKLTTLHLDGACCILQTIGSSCKELEELSIEYRCYSCSLQPLPTLKSLKILELFFANGADLKFLSDLPQLIELRLHEFEKQKPDDFGQFALLTQLTKLHLERMKGLVASDVVEIIKRLINLEELSVAVTLDEQTFSRIVGLVKGRPHVLTLECKFDFNWKNCDENQKVKLLRCCASDY